MKPIIGILASVDGEKTVSVGNAYVSAIEMAGGIPLVFPCVNGEDTLSEIVSRCDGLLFSGGADLDPSRYGEKKSDMCGEVQRNRDELEFRAFEVAFESKTPILGICRGAQLINAALGGKLWQDIQVETDTPILHR